MQNKFTELLKDKIFTGVVEDIQDPKRKGRVKIRIDRLHGRVDDQDKIPTDVIPWASPDLDNRGLAFSIPAIGKVVHVEFLEGDFYKPVYTSTEHYNYNLQEKLQELTKEGYVDFYAITFDDKHQYFHDKDKGIIFDYVKSNFNIDPKGNMYLNLRDNNSKLFLGTEDASQQAMLGNHWIDWFDELVQNLMGTKGGPYLGNLGAPVIPNPGMLEVLNKYLALKQTFLSDHVYIVDDKRVKSQTRKNDKKQDGDTFNTEKQESTKAPSTTGYQPQDRAKGAELPVGNKVPSDTYGKNLSSTALPENPTTDELKKLEKPFEGYGNGRLPIEKLTQSKYIKESFPDGEQSYLLDEATKALDSFLDVYNNQKKSSWSNIVITKGYQNYERQENARKQYPMTAPIAGKDPFGNANQVELYWGIEGDDRDKAKKLLNNSLPSSDMNSNMEVLKWLKENGSKYGWKLAGRDFLGESQWWHWIYEKIF